MYKGHARDIWTEYILGQRVWWY